MGRSQFTYVGFLGEGGSATVYKVKDTSGSHFACKVVSKSSHITRRARAQLSVEINIHRSLRHTNIVYFQGYFDDHNYYYMTLELCTSGSLMDMHHCRQRFTEPEARLYLVQLTGACHYMHTHQVIHRDLKLSNLFLDGNMNVKVGDFGLAAFIENPGERETTVCGTLDYMAPEVLFGAPNGYSFEADTWSIGVILYTLVVGQLPFESKDVKGIKKRIRGNNYEFPPGSIISFAVRHLISQILTPDPSKRPTLHEIVAHAFFTEGPVPSSIPPLALYAPPDFTDIMKGDSDRNLKMLKEHSWLDVNTSLMATPSCQN